MLERVTEGLLTGRKQAEFKLVKLLKMGNKEGLLATVFAPSFPPEVSPQTVQSAYILQEEKEKLHLREHSWPKGKGRKIGQRFPKESLGGSPCSEATARTPNHVQRAFPVSAPPSLA